MMETKYYIGFSILNKDNAYIFITDPALPSVGQKMQPLKVDALTSSEKKALAFNDLDTALEWCDANLEDFIAENYGNWINQSYNWDNPVIIKSDYTVISL